jgi:hypothetical protein
VTQFFSQGGNIIEVMNREPTVNNPANKLKNQEVITSFGSFNFAFLDSPTYQNSPARAEIDKLNLPDLFVRTAEKAVKELAIDKPVSVTVMIPSPEDESFIIPSLGIGAYTFYNDKIVFQFDPAHPDIVANLKKWQGGQIGHELNHWARGDFYGEETLLNALIFEGLATVYEESWGGEKIQTPWGHALTPEQLKAEWQKAKTELDSTDFDYQDWFFGKSEGHPNWTGYTLGTAIVKAYLYLHPNTSMKELVRKPSTEILRESKFI